MAVWLYTPALLDKINIDGEHSVIKAWYYSDVPLEHRHKTPLPPLFFGKERVQVQSRNRMVVAPFS